MEVFMKHDQRLHAPHVMLDIVKLKENIMHLETSKLMGVASLLHEYDHYYDHLKV